MLHLDRLAEQDAALDTHRRFDERCRLNAELDEIPDTVRSLDDRSIN
jgi:hypothetical protein